MKRTLLLLAALTLATNYIFAVNAGSRFIRYAKAVDKNGRLTHEGDTVKIKGIVQSLEMPSALAGTSYFFSIYDSTSSITVYLARLKGGGKNGYNYTYSPALGDSVSLSGIVTMYTVANGFAMDSTGFAVIAPLQAKGFDITQINTGNPVHPALIVPGFKEKEESDLIELDSVTLVNPAKWVTSFALFTDIAVKSVNDTSKKYVLHVPYDVIAGKVPYGTFNVKGILYQQDITAPYLSNYMLIPRDYSDITIIIPPVYPLHNIADVNAENALGVADSTGKLVHIKGIVQSPNLYPSSLGNGLAFSIFDKTGSILVYNTTTNMGYTPTIGDSFFVEGTINQIKSIDYTKRPPVQFNTGWTYILPDSIAIPSNAHNMPIRDSIVTTGFNDSLESKLISLKKVKLVDTTQWDTTGTTNPFTRQYTPKYQMYVDLVDENHNYTRACILRIDSFFSMPKPIYEFNITGIEGQDSISPLKFSIYPRFVRDIQLIAPKVPYYKISQVKGNDGNGVATSINKLGYLVGVVHSENLVSTGLKFSLVDATGAITVYSSSAVSSYMPMRGDSIITYGKIGQINGLTVIYPDSIKKISSYNPLQNTFVVSLLIEADESYPRRLQHVKLVSATQWNPAASAGTNGFSITVKDTASSDTFSVFISSATTAFKLAAPMGSFNVTGIVQQSDPSSPFNTGYYLEPRDSQDIWMLSKGVEGIENQGVNQIPVTIYPNPAGQNVHVLFGDLKGEAVIMNLYSATGILVYSEKVYGSSTMNISNLPQGMYFIKMTTNNGLQSSSKLIKE